MANHNFIAYRERTRAYYRAQGFTKDYDWAHHDDVPFTLLEKPLAECNVTVVTTAVANPSVPKPVRTAESILFKDAPETFLTDELSWDKETTHMEDRESYFPANTLQRLVSEGFIGRLAPRFHFIPTQYSIRATTLEDAPAIARQCLADEVDIALLVPI